MHCRSLVLVEAADRWHGQPMSCRRAASDIRWRAPHGKGRGVPTDPGGAAMGRLGAGATLAMRVVTPGTSAANPSEEAAKQSKKSSEAIAVYHELITTPDKEVPQQLLERCKCVAVLPGVLKAALGYGARHGSGVMACRTANGWSAPAFVNLSGGSVGFQLGAESTDLVLFFMTDRGARSVMKNSRIT